RTPRARRFARPRSSGSPWGIGAGRDPRHCNRAVRDPRIAGTVRCASRRRKGMRVTVTSDQIRTAFEAVKDDPSFDESRGLWERGQPPVEMLQGVSPRPEILRAFAGFGDAVYPGGLLERRVKELVILTASHGNACQFCENAHC